MIGGLRVKNDTTARRIDTGQRPRREAVVTQTPSPSTRGWIDRVLADLATGGSRLTGPRRHILDHVLGYTAPFTAEELIADLQAAGSRVGRATVYRTLELL